MTLWNMNVVRIEATFDLSVLHLIVNTTNVYQPILMCNVS